MWMIILTLFIVGSVAYVWCTRGFFSSLIHMICVIAAGAIAFGVWELLAALIRDNAPQRGGFTWVQGAAAGLALALPFAAALAILRGFVDKILPANAQCEKTIDYIGGGACGAVSGVISAGIVVLSIMFLRGKPEAMGYASAMYTDGIGRGSIQKNSQTFVPWVDRIVAGMYSRLSETTLRTGDPLAKWYPELASYPGELRITYDGKSRNSLSSKDVNLLSWYTVGAGNQYQGAPIKSLLSDSWSAAEQKVSDLEGEQYTGNHYLAGFTLKFLASARERTGSTFFGAGQLRLVVGPADEPDSTDTKAVHPIAVICRTDNPIRVEYARFRFDSDVFFSSVGAESEPVVAFEFPVEAGYKPLALYVKGVRFIVEDQAPFKQYPNVVARDSQVELGEFPHMGGVGPILDDQGRPLQADPNAGPTISAQPVTVSASIGFTVQKGTEGGNLNIVNDDGKGWAIQDGTTKIPINRMNNSGLERNLRIDRFVVTNNTALVKVVITPSQRPDEFVKLLDTVDSSQVPLLEDTNGTTYPAIGYIYRDTTKVEIRYTQATPLKSFGEAPRVTRNTPDKQLTLLFVVNNGVDLREFRIGSVVLDSWPSNRPFRVDMPFRR